VGEGIKRGVVDSEECVGDGKEGIEEVEDDEEEEEEEPKEDKSPEDDAVEDIEEEDDVTIVRSSLTFFLFAFSACVCNAFSNTIVTLGVFF